MGGSVCAIVPTFNRSAMLLECIGSLLAQTRALDEIIVVDDGSTDDTPTALAALPSQVLVIRQANAGKASALNAALTMCRADYVWICDDDDLAAPDACEKLVGALDGHPTAGLAYGQFARFEDVDGQRRYLPMSFWPDEEASDFFLALAERFFICQFSSMVTRRAFEAAGPFRTDMLRSQDYEMTLRLARRETAVRVPGVLFYQRRHAGVRGASEDRFSARQSERKWLDYDRRFFVDLLPQLSAEELTPNFARGFDAPARLRISTIQRACLYGKRALWNEALGCLESACALNGGPLGAGELAIAGRILSDDLVCDDLESDPRALGRLRALAGNTVGRKLLAVIIRPLAWKSRNAARDGDWVTLRQRIGLMSRLLGPTGAARALGSAAVRRLGGQALAGG